MKKEYKKPQVFIENFTLTESIAACDEVNIVSQLECTKSNGNMDGAYEGFQDAGKGLPFTDGYTCDFEGDDVKYGEGWKICYHTSPDLPYTVFNS